MGKKIQNNLWKEKIRGPGTECHRLILGAIYYLQFKRMSSISNKTLLGEKHFMEQI